MSVIKQIAEEGWQFSCVGEVDATMGVVAEKGVERRRVLKVDPSYDMTISDRMEFGKLVADLLNKEVSKCSTS